MSCAVGLPPEGGAGAAPTHLGAGLPPAPGREGGREKGSGNQGGTAGGGSPAAPPPPEGCEEPGRRWKWPRRERLAPLRGAEPGLVRGPPGPGGVLGPVLEEAAVISCPSGAEPGSAAALVAPGLCRSTLDLLRQQAPAGVCGRGV